MNVRSRVFAFEKRIRDVSLCDGVAAVFSCHRGYSTDFIEGKSELYSLCDTHFRYSILMFVVEPIPGRQRQRFASMHFSHVPTVVEIIQRTL